MPKPKKHRRKGPKSTRVGCLHCKPHKRQGVDIPTQQERRARVDESEQIRYSLHRSDPDAGTV